jgi:hypothetical protein
VLPCGIVSFSATFSNSDQVFGGLVMPAFSKAVLL